MTVTHRQRLFLLVLLILVAAPPSLSLGDSQSLTLFIETIEDGEEETRVDEVVFAQVSAPTIELPNLVTHSIFGSVHLQGFQICESHHQRGPPLT